MRKAWKTRFAGCPSPNRAGADTVRAELLEDQRELSAQEPRLKRPEAALEGLEIRPHRRIAVDRDEAAAAVQILGEQHGMASCAEGAVDDRLVRLHRKQPANVLGENGNVISRAWRQDARQHLLRSLRPRRAR